MVLISIVMGYYNRKSQIINTLNDFQKKYGNRTDFEVVIVDDYSVPLEQLYDILDNYTFSINYIFITEKEKGDRINPGYVYNKGFSVAKGKIIIIQNPECYHVNNIIDYTIKNLQENQYFVYSCYATMNQTSTDKLLEQKDIIKTLESNNWSTCLATRPNKMSNGMWYNHPVIRPVGLHFCSAIFKSQLDMLGGFDKIFDDGFSYEDSAFLLSIEYKLKLQILIKFPQEGLVIHQFHGQSHYNKDYDFIRRKKHIRNMRLYEVLKKNCLEKGVYTLK